MRVHRKLCGLRQSDPPEVREREREQQTGWCRSNSTQRLIDSTNSPQRRLTHCPALLSLLCSLCTALSAVLSLCTRLCCAVSALLSLHCLLCTAVFDLLCSFSALHSLLSSLCRALSLSALLSLHCLLFTALSALVKCSAMQNRCWLPVASASADAV